MNNRQIPLIKVTDKETARALNQIKTVVDRNLALTFPTGQLVKAIPVTVNTSFTVKHNLGRAWTGYIVTRVYAGAVGGGAGQPKCPVEDAATLSTTPNLTINLQSLITGTIDLYVF